MNLFGHRRFISLEFFNVLDSFPEIVSSIYIDKERVEFDEPVQELDISLQKVNRLDEIDIERIRNEFIEVYNVSGHVLEELEGESSEGFLIDEKIFLEPSWEQQGWQRFGKFLLINREVHPPKIRVINIPCADTVLHLDPWWNPAVEEQATARAHRMGQKIPFLFIVFLVSKA